MTGRDRLIPLLYFTLQRTGALFEYPQYRQIPHYLIGSGKLSRTSPPTLPAILAFLYGAKNSGHAVIERHPADSVRLHAVRVAVSLFLKGLDRTHRAA